jgi:hypothetical protein
MGEIRQMVVVVVVRHHGGKVPLEIGFEQVSASHDPCTPRKPHTRETARA